MIADSTFIKLACSAVFLLGILCYERGRRYHSLSGDAVLDDDPRAPVLYLRSFSDDAEASAIPTASGILPQFVRRTEEEQLADALNEIGPFIALGRPGEDLPPLGAARLYVHDIQWQLRVTDLMRRAQLVILRPGDGASFWWEIDQAVQTVQPERLVFVLPFDKKGYEAFRQKAEEHLPRKLPEYPKRAKPSVGSLAAVLYFGNDWKPCIARLKLPFYMIKANPAGASLIPGYAWVAPRNPVTFLFKRALQPVIERLGLKWKKRPRSRIVYVPLVLALPFLAMMLYLQFTGLVHKSDHEAKGYVLRGEQLWQAGQIDKAISEYKHALRLKPKWPRAHLDLCTALVQKGEAIPEDKGDLTAAVTECQEAVHLDRDSPGAHNLLGNALSEKPDPDMDGAILQYREALRLDSHLPAVHYNLCLALLGEGQRGEAIKECAIAHDLDPHNNEIAKQYDYLSSEGK